MPIVFACSSCQKQMKVPDNVEGRPVKCPHCGEVTTVPGAPAPPAPAVAAAPPRVTAPARPATTSPAPAPAAATAPARPKVTVVCPGCRNKLLIKAELAG